MTAQERLDTELERRQLHRLKPDTLAQVRRLCTHPGTAKDMFEKRLIRGCAALNEQETPYRWELFELILNAYVICEDAIEQQRRDHEAAYIQRLRTDEDLQQSRLELRRRNYRSTKEYLEREEGGSQVPLPESEPDPRKPTLKLGKR